MQPSSYFVDGYDANTNSIYEFNGCLSGMEGTRNFGQRVQRVLDRWTNRQWKDTGSSMAV